MARALLQASLSDSGAHSEQFGRSDFWALTLGSIGVVYGDIGTSPLYALRESVLATGGLSEATNAEIILGILSLIIWALVLVVTVKYVLLLLRADNDGEGGTLALMALTQRALGGHSLLVLSLGIIAAALFYGDAMLTPAVSVLSAVEGLEVAAPSLQFYVVPLTVIILVALFAVQSRGTASVASFFGPITFIWFLAIAAAGLWHISQNLTVLQAFSPVYAISFLTNHGLIGFLTLGAVFLAVTGAEALYADLGHFGRVPIQTAWLSVVLPALTINYLGQGALLLSNPQAVENPFFSLYPNWRSNLGFCHASKSGIRQGHSSGKSMCRASTQYCCSVCCFL
jgi:KUP system potassium uptake protein